MATITAKAIPSNLEVGEQSLYRLVPKNTVKFTEDEFLAALAEKVNQDKIQARYWCDAFRDVLFTKLLSNFAVDLGFLYAKLHIGGSLNSATEQPSKEKNPVRARIFSKGILEEAFDAVEVINDTQTIAAVLYEIMQDNASDVNRIEEANTRVVINGSKIKVMADREDEGIWLENIDTGIVVATANVSYSDESTAYCTFATLPSTGRYRLVVGTRNGEDADEYALAKVTRNVYVVND